MTRFIAACVQVNSRDVMSDNLARAATYARDAHAAGARLIAFPENVSMMSFGGENVRAAAFPEDEHPGLVFFCDLAEELRSTLIVGSLHVKVPDEDRVANRCFVIGPDGKVITSYDKIHMFDVDLANGESYRESKTFRPGNAARLAETEFGKVGITICYDVRFPHLFRDYAKAGANILSIPAAFTRTTGQAHWHTLLKARAIENGCFVIAAAQCGDHPGGRQTFGHSLIIDPWGQVLADGGTDPGFITAEIDLTRVDEIRRMVPSLGNDREYKPC
ncbi:MULTISPECIES: carbon-nitrogen hydrolase family protein [Thalassospira]|uniref:Amidohydrolase n=2 Tax=Thalassospira tepidiphila TaxID=393657 RepID=A0A853L408_9PROT|nr:MULTISPECIES: carbon-nitrogen hydrolase family protein [Thalassospira]MBO6578848.1 carbon-nitrogen hydrolase family protein [Thalassospira sp.]MBO6804760.1 carbon-nitrogen hydrolase family protein [Thalassospira sp.]MBO6816845.1 carbon-nitrogen hydrolase family protein [Thalassospira sp.]MBO6889037.1 carbon-nitrogen hydrolase family protein [Thalassospira sp.]NJB74292.1 putative amidohydrolase [Thalassospira tepidiphila]